MTDDQIEKLIFNKIKKHGITWLDMVGGIAISYEADHQRVCRNNIFKARSWSDRLIEIICEGDYDPFAKSHLIRVSNQDLVRFWWNNIICQEDMMDDILEDIFVYFKDQLLPKKDPEPAVTYNLDFSKVILKQNSHAPELRKRAVGEM